MSTDVRLHFAPTGDLLEQALDCEAEVFLRWYGNTRQQLADEYGPYQDASVFLALEDSDGDVVAAMRLIAPGGSAGFKTLADIGRDPWRVDGMRSARVAGIDLRTTWDVATVGTRRTSRAHGMRHSFALYHGLGIVARVNAMTTFTAVLDERVRRLLDQVGLITQPFPGTAPGHYLGSDASSPVYAHTAPMLDNQRRRFPDAFSLVTMGVGMDGVSIPPDSTFVHRPAVTTPAPVLAGVLGA